MLGASGRLSFRPGRLRGGQLDVNRHGSSGRWPRSSIILDIGLLPSTVGSWPGGVSQGSLGAAPNSKLPLGKNATICLERDRVRLCPEDPSVELESGQIAWGRSWPGSQCWPGLWKQMHLSPSQVVTPSEAAPNLSVNCWARGRRSVEGRLEVSARMPVAAASCHCTVLPGVAWPAVCRAAGTLGRVGEGALSPPGQCGGTSLGRWRLPSELGGPARQLVQLLLVLPPQLPASS